VIWEFDVMIARCLLIAAACVAIAEMAVPAGATSGWGCFQVINVRSDDSLNMRAKPSASSAVVDELGPRRHGIIAEDGACKPVGSPPSRQWCPIKHFNGDRTTRGWVRMIYLAPSECP
jgi:hypothetical protein